MRYVAYSLAMSIMFAAAGSAAPPTMRVDYYHTGNDKEERFSLDRVVVEPLPWPGNPSRPLDDTDRGKYFFEVVDAPSAWHSAVWTNLNTPADYETFTQKSL